MRIYMYTRLETESELRKERTYINILQLAPRKMQSRPIFAASEQTARDFRK